MQGRVVTFPSDSHQSFVGPWWRKAPDGSIRRGRLLWAHMRHIDLVPQTLEENGRIGPTQHDSFRFQLKPLDVTIPVRRNSLPVAGLPTFAGEVHLVQRAKKRPVVVLSNGGDDVPSSLRREMAKWITSQTILVAPYYGTEATGTRGGWPATFLDRVRHCEWPQYVYDQLPVGGSSDVSVLRLDHLQPIGATRQSFEVTDHELTEGALSLLDEWLSWLLTGEMPAGEDAFLAEIREALQGVASAEPSPLGGS